MSQDIDLTDLQGQLLDDLAALRKVLGPKYRKVKGTPAKINPSTSSRQAAAPQETRRHADMLEEAQEEIIIIEQQRRRQPVLPSPAQQQQQQQPVAPDMLEAAKTALETNKALQNRLRRLMISVRNAQDANANIRFVIIIIIIPITLKT